jgi:hypothetical protein
MVSPDSMGTACPLSGRNSTYRPVQISGTGSDKDVYQSIFSTLTDAARQSTAREPFANWFTTWHVRFGRDGGVQGHRPVDLWASIINREPDAFGRFPQVYAIASGAGLELGFAVSIHESDYYNPFVKEKNREIIPLLYRKLPSPNSELVRILEEQLTQEGGWQFGMKARQGPEGEFPSFAKLIHFLRSRSSLQGGGAIYRLMTPEELTPTFNLERAFSDAVVRFAPLMRALTPSAAEQVRLTEMDLVRKEAEKLPPFEPSDMQDGRRRV